MSIEMHCHTEFSVDSYGSPEHLVDWAAERGVSALAVTEHNHLGSAARVAARAAERGIRCFAGVELDAFLGESSFHFLGFGFDPHNTALRALADRNRLRYVHRFELCLAHLHAMGFPRARREIEAHLAVRYPEDPSPTLSTYALAHFIEYNGLEGYAEMYQAALEKTAEEDAAAPLEPGEPGQFCRFEEARDAVHSAGGVILLAHVAHNLCGRREEQMALIRELVDEGADGFELYHWTNLRESWFDELARLGADIGCVLSGGSDCHNAPGKPPREIGGCGAPDAFADRLGEALARRASGCRGEGEAVN